MYELSLMFKDLSFPMLGLIGLIGAGVVCKVFQWLTELLDDTGFGWVPVVIVAALLGWWAFDFMQAAT